MWQADPNTWHRVALFRRGQAYVLAARHMVVAKAIRRFGDATDILDGGVLLPRQRRAADIGDHRRGNAEFH
jgi:hypothetical protein